jgi:hypothetical protein
LSRIYPVYISWDGAVWRIVETSSGGLSSELWREGAWVKAGSVAELDFKGKLLSESQALALTSSATDK